jgi:Zn-dependent protease with chaperone function
VDKPNRLVEVFFYTHPPASKRIKLAEEWTKQTAGAQ